MQAILFSVITWAMAGLVQRVLVGAGLSLVVFSGLSALVTGSMDLASTYLGGLPGDILQFVLLTGIGHAISIIGSAVLSRVAMVSAANVMGIRKT